MALKKLFLVTIDCDMRAPDVGLREQSLRTLYDVFDECGVAGHITWFLNENDFSLTGHHAAFLRQVLKKGDCLGIHDHLDKFKRPLKKENLLAYCRRSKEQLEKFLKKEGRPGAVKIHRNGCLVQDPEIYAALKELGYTICSDVYPGQFGLDHSGNPGFDNRFIPEGIRPYRHDEDSINNYWTTIRLSSGKPGLHLPYQGHFLQIPVWHMYLTLDWDRLERWIKIAEAVEFTHPLTSGKSPVVLTWCFHPYEIMNGGRTAIHPEKRALLKKQVEALLAREMVFLTIEECVKKFKGVLYDTRRP